MLGSLRAAHLGRLEEKVKQRFEVDSVKLDEGKLIVKLKGVFGQRSDKLLDKRAGQARRTGEEARRGEEATRREEEGVHPSPWV